MCYKNYGGVIQTLLQSHPDTDVNLTNDSGVSPLMGAVRRGFMECARALLSRTDLDLEIKNKKGETAETIARSRNNQEMIKLLSEARRNREEQRNKEEGDAMDDDSMCKICMDFPIDCVMLECGHMCTCTNCGKQMAECPICRQYVVRVVKTFKA